MQTVLGQAFQKNRAARPGGRALRKRKQRKRRKTEARKQRRGMPTRSPGPSGHPPSQGGFSVFASMGGLIWSLTGGPGVPPLHTPPPPLRGTSPVKREACRRPQAAPTASRGKWEKPRDVGSEHAGAEAGPQHGNFSTRPGPRGPGRNGATHTDLHAPEIFRARKGVTPVMGVLGGGGVENEAALPPKFDRDRPLAPFWFLFGRPKRNSPPAGGESSLRKGKERRVREAAPYRRGMT